MSSLKHQPNSKKRRIIQATPEFPSFSVFSLEDVVEFAKKSQQAVESVDFSANSTSLFLPLITPHRLQYRLTVDKDQSVFVVIRNEYSKLKEVVDNLNNNGYSGIYIQGPVGIGKSYLLYTLASQCHADRRNYSVTFINDCSAWRVDRYGYLLKELVMTFYDDVIQEKSILAVNGQ